MILAFVSMVAGALLGALGFLGLTERLPLNRFAGVRTAATMRDEDTFRIGNKVAGLPILVAGLIGVLGGALALTTPLVVAVLAIVGMLAITVSGGVLGNKAAAAMPEPEPELPAGCKGCACGAGGCGVLKKA